MDSCGVSRGLPRCLAGSLAWRRAVKLSGRAQKFTDFARRGRPRCRAAEIEDPPDGVYANELGAKYVSSLPREKQALFNRKERDSLDIQHASLLASWPWGMLKH